jgi:outer membrane receptor protein involved in Fe transport
MLTLRLSAGKGYRSPHAWAENHYLLASGRDVTVAEDLRMEEAWNSGLSAAFNIPVGEQTLKLNAEYYYTNFINQLVVDYDSDPTKISIGMLKGKSFSHTVQVDGSIDIDEELELMLAYRYNNVKCTYGGKLMEKPLTSRYKGLLTVAWKPYMGLIQVDVTLQLNGGGRMPKPYRQVDGALSWDKRFPAYPQLNIQVTRRFRHVSVYVGGENLTNYRQPIPVFCADDPWSDMFEPTLIWGPVHGIMAYAGVRVNI